MFREIRTRERITEKDRIEEERNKNYLKIKPSPEFDMTVEECKNFWDEMLNSMRA